MLRLPQGLSGKNPPANAGDVGQGEPLETRMATTPLFLRGKSHGQRSVVGCSPWGPKRVGEDLESKQQQQDSVLKLGTYSLVISPSDYSVR